MESLESALSQEEDRQVKLTAVAEKFNACRGIVAEQYGVTNVYKVAEYLYFTLYHPEELEKIELPENPKFPNRNTNLRTSTLISANKIPDKDEFIKKIRHVMTQETAFDEALFPGAMEELEKMMEMGPVNIWTKGDSTGLTADEENLPGSSEQLKKTAKAGLNELRRKIANKTGKNKQEILRITAAENKKAIIPDVLEQFSEKGISRVIVLEDNLKNLVAFMNEASKRKDIEVTPIWVRQGARKNKFPKEPTNSEEEWKREYNAIDSITEAVQKIKELGISNETELLGFIVDYDDVLSDDRKKQAKQAAAVLHALESKDWI